MADLTTLADVKEWLSTGNPGSFPPSDDRLLSRLITACSVFLESWISRPLGIANWQEIRDGMGGESANRMQLAVFPVTAILSLSIDGIPIPPAPPMTQQGWMAGYAFSQTEIVLRGWRFGRGAQNVLVQYTAGYDTIPGDIQQTCIEMVVRKYRERTRIAERSRSLGGAETVAYETVMFTKRDMASDIQVLLSQYKLASPLLAPTLLLPDPADIVVEDGAQPVADIVTEDDVTPVEVEQ
jgi:hypothetical protein